MRTKSAQKNGPIAARPARSLDVLGAAFLKTAGEIDAVSSERAGQINLDVTNAVSLMLGALDGIRSLEPQMVEAFKHPPLEAMARMADRAHALLHCQLQLEPVTENLDADLEEARLLRDLLLVSADAHVAHGHFGAQSVVAIREGSGHLDRANDLLALGALYDAVWDEIEDKTPVRRAQVDRARSLGMSLVVSLGRGSLGKAASSGPSWRERRRRAYRLFIEDYDAIRRAVEYLRYDEGDANSFVPMLSSRGRAKRKGGDSDDELEILDPTPFITEPDDKS